MTQLLFIETFVFGSSLIAAIYHLVLFIQQKDKFLLFYSIYLFAASAYLSFKLFSNNYDPFLPTSNTRYYTTEEILQVIMYSSYATFAAVTLEVTKKPLMVKWCWIGLLIFSGITIIVHISKAIFIGPGITTSFAYGFSRLTTIAVAGFALMMAWKVRTTVFQKTIIIGSYVYAFFAMFSVFSFIFKQSYFGLSGVEPYLIGSFIDIIIFSGALGYRFKKIADEKNKLLQQFLETAESKGIIAKSLNDNVGAALSSMHIYASVAENLMSKDPNKSVDFLKQIKENSLQIMDDVSDIIWALKLSPADIIEALPLRIKQHGLEILATYHIACNYELEEVAMLSIHDVATAKTILTQVKQATLLAIKPSVSNQLAIAVRLVDNAITISVT